MSSKIRIKMGPIEIEYEGNESFLKKELRTLLGSVADLYKERKAFEDEGAVDDEAGDIGDVKPVSGSTGQFALKLKCKTGADLALAAAGHLAITQHKSSFTRGDLLHDMKSATGFYQKNYSSNLPKYLRTLAKNDKLKEVSKDTYSLTDAMRKEIKAKIAR